MPGIYSDPLKFLADFHTFMRLLWVYRDWNTVGGGYHQLPFHRSELYTKLDKLVNAGFLIKRKDEETNRNYYRVISKRIVIPEFGAIQLDDYRPMIYVFIDPHGDIVRQLKWNPDRVYVFRRLNHADT